MYKILTIENDELPQDANDSGVQEIEQELQATDITFDDDEGATTPVNWSANNSFGNSEDDDQGDDPNEMNLTGVSKNQP